MDSLALLGRAIQQLQEESLSVPGPVAGEERRLWQEFQQRIYDLRSEFQRQLTNARNEGFDDGWQRGMALASNHCPECGASAVEAISDDSDYACWGGPIHEGYRCPDGHEWWDEEEDNDEF